MWINGGSSRATTCNGHFLYQLALHLELFQVLLHRSISLQLGWGDLTLLLECGELLSLQELLGLKLKEYWVDGCGGTGIGNGLLLLLGLGMRPGRLL
jgi:hypothetical protein